MGVFLVEVQAVGAHGCERHLKDSEVVIGCERHNCVDCITREYIRRLKRANSSIDIALLTHWPGTEQEVNDNLLTGVRMGNF